MENPEIEQNRDRIQKVLTNLGIEHSMSAVDEWRKVLFHRGECRNIEEYIALLREVVQRGDEEKTPVERPNQAGKIIGKILLERKEKLQTEQQPPRTTSRNLSQEIEDASLGDPNSKKQTPRRRRRREVNLQSFATKTLLFVTNAPELLPSSTSSDFLFF